MADVIFERCCSDTPSLKPQEGWVTMICPGCGRKMQLFPINMMEPTCVPNERLIPREIAEEAARKWNESLLKREEVNG